MPVSFLFEIATKTTAVLLVVWGLTRLLSRASSATRHLAWTVGIVAILAVPVAVALGPSWTVSVPPALQESLESREAANRAPASGPSPTTISPTVDVLPAVLSVPALAMRRATPPVQLGLEGPNWPLLLTGLWGVGVLFGVLKLAVGLGWVAWIRRRATELVDPEWQALLSDASSALGLATPVTLLVGGRATVPVTWGIWRPVLLLPSDAGRWSPSRRRVVLLHELAHVKRRDCLVQTLASVASALYWFNPLVFVATASLRHEQERACDDLVLATGTSGPEYADHLLDLAGGFRAAAVPAWVTLAMARPSQLEGRVLAILDDARRRTPPRTAVRLIVAMSAVAVALGLGAFRLSAADRPDSPGQDVELDLEHADDLVFHDHPLDALAAEHFLDYSGDPIVHAMPNPGSHPFPVLAAQDASATRVEQDEVSEETRQRVADALVTALDDDDQRVREQAINSLVAMRDERAVRGLVQSLSDPVVEVRARGVQGLQRFDTPEAIGGLQTALEDESPQVRARAVRALGQRRTTEAVPAIIALLQDSEATVRARAASALGMIRDDRAIDPLTAALKDPEPAVRERAARALGDLARAQRRRSSVFPFTAPVPPVPPDVRFFAPEIDLDFATPDIDIDIDFEEIRRIQDEALAGIDFDKIREMHDRALAEADASLAEVESSLEDFEWPELLDLRERFERDERPSR